MKTRKNRGNVFEDVIQIGTYFDGLNFSLSALIRNSGLPMQVVLLLFFSEVP